LVNLKTKSAGDGYPKKAIEKTVLRFLGSCTFLHGLDPKPSFRLTPPMLHRLALANEASELHHEELETASRFVSMMIIATAWSSTDR
jgi:hypothetical protein